MSDLTFRFVEGQYMAPTRDNVNRVTPNTIIDNRPFELENNVLRTFLWQKSKQVGSAGVARVGNLTGNRSLQRNLEFLNDVTADIGTVLTGVTLGGVPGAAIAVGAIAIQKAIRAFDINLGYYKDTIDSDEQARRAGFIRTDKRREHR